MVKGGEQWLQENRMNDQLSDCSCLQVAELARRLWSEGGEQWLQENRMNDQLPQTVLVSR